MRAYFAALALVLLTLALATPSSAQSPFDGTWKVDPEKSKLSDKPIETSLNDGFFECSGCLPKISHVKADGEDHKATNDQFDTINIREVDPRSLEILFKRNGKLVFKQTYRVSPDGKTLSRTLLVYSPDKTQPIVDESRADRIGDGQGISGSWRVVHVRSSEDELPITIRTNGNEIQESSPDGDGYTAKLDGKDYPAKGGPVFNAVSLRRLEDRAIEETDKLNGKAISVWRMTVSPDGKTMTETGTFLESGRTITYIEEKQ